MRTPSQAVAIALLTKTNVPGYCQLVTRTWLDAPSAGDVDGDGAADAEDGWKREPLSARRYDKKPPAGYPVSWLGGSNDNGHRALSLGPINGIYYVRSTDAGGRGIVASVPLDWVEENWGLSYAGWSTTMNGVPIPKDKFTRGWRVDAALKKLVRAERRATEGKPRDTKLDRAISILKSIPKRIKKS